MLREQILAREAYSDGEALGAFAHQHDVPRVLEHGLRDQRHVLDVAYAADRAGSPRGSVHAAGIEFDDSFFVWNSAEANAGVIRIVFRTLDNAKRGVERIAAAFEEREGVFEVRISVISTDDNGALVRSGLRIVFLRATLLRVFGLGSGSYSGGDCS
jgi:hypothetical protein